MTSTSAGHAFRPVDVAAYLESVAHFASNPDQVRRHNLIDFPKAFAEYAHIFGVQFCS